MMDNFQQISAVAALYKILAIKRFHTLENYAHLVQIPLVAEINKEAIDLIKVNLFSTVDSESLAEYERFLSNRLSRDLSHKTNKAFIEEGVELIEKAKLLSQYELKGYSISFLAKSDANNNLKSVAQTLNAFGLTKPTAVSIIKNAQFVQVVDIGPKFFLVSSRAVLKSKEVVLLFLLSESGYNSTTVKSSELVVQSIMCFADNNLRFNSPARLFLQALNRYGISITIGDDTRKLFLEGFVSRLSINPRLGIKFNAPIGERHFYHYLAVMTSARIKYYFVYDLRYEKQISDFKSGHLLE